MTETIYRAFCALLTFWIWGMCSLGFAQRNLKDIPPADPELERQALELAEGFEINLFAADPRIAKPIQMNFDPEGRMWLATSEVYPHIKPGQQANDKILILEDRDGDGTAEKTTVFAEGLLIPTGVAPGDGGAYVANSTEVLHFRDTDGDGKADTKRIVLSGFGTEDTHHILHTFRWGPGGHLYFNQSIYIHSHIETPYGVKRLNGGGIWKFRPKTWDLEVFARGWINPWGHQFDRYGQSFVTDGAGGEGINYLLPGAAYRTAVGVKKILPGLNPGSPKYCGLEIVSGRHLPDDWQGNLLTHDFRGHRVCRFVVSNDGAGFAARQEADLIKSKHVAFRPVDVKMGPDGAIYIADWYNPIIQHGEVDFRDPRRDHTHGRIWRVTYKDRPLVKRPQLKKASISELLDHLKDPEGWTRHQAKRELATRDPKDVAKELEFWTTEALQVKDLKRLDHLRLEALWTYQSVGRIEPTLLESLMHHGATPEVRAAAVRVAGDWLKEQPELANLLPNSINDSHPRVRLEAVRAIAKIGGNPQAIVWALEALDQPTDRWLEHALWLTCRDTADDWLPLLKAGTFQFGGDARKMAFALEAVGSPDVISSLTKLLKQNALSNEGQLEVLKVIATLGGPQELQLVLVTALNAQTTDPDRQVLLQRLAETSRNRRVRPAGDVGGLSKLFQQDNLSQKILVTELAGLWKIQSLRKPMTELARAESTPAALRQSVLRALTNLGGPESRKVLEEIASSNKPWDVRVLALESLASLNLPAAANHVVDILVVMPAEKDPSPVFASFLQRKQGPEQLAMALKSQTIPTDAAKVGLRLIESTGRPLKGLENALKTAGQISGEPKPLTPEEKAALVADVQSTGDASHGELVFRRESLSCLKCHAIGGAGGRVGPDLLSLGASAQVDYLLESLLEPNKKIKENYNSLIVATDEGKIITGVKVRQSDTHLILRDVNDAEVSIPLASIEAQKNGKSLMPSSLTEKLTRNELIDLVRFLSELGKVGKFAIGKERVARRWQVLDDTPTARYRLRRTSYDSVTKEDPAYTWRPAYSKVSGVLPLDTVPRVGLNLNIRGKAGIGFLRTEMDVTQAGSVKLKFNQTDHLQFWLDGKPVNVQTEMTVPLETGRHVLTFAVNLEQRDTGLRLELADVPSSPAQVQFLTGK